MASSLPARMGEKLLFSRVFSVAGRSVWDSVEWHHVDAEITGADGRPIFRQSGVEAPSSWSLQAVRVAASKYFAGAPTSEAREASVRHLIERVVTTIVGWGRESELFESEPDIEAFSDELTYLLLHQHAAFNSPVWFNLGVEPSPQCSACFINSVDDSLQSILELAKTEGLLFKHGSGTGTNLSVLRGSQEPISKGGTASGPVSFMRGFDAFAGVIKSGGRTRRAAKMVILDAEHPDVLDFVRSKAKEERKAWALIDAGYDGSIDGEAYGSVAFQNANHSVRVPDSFWEAVESDGEWRTVKRTDRRSSESMSARELLNEIAEAAWVCGDPGVQYDDTIQRWHTCKASGRINASNPCSEYVFLDDTACNLASLNLMHFVQDDGSIAVTRLKQAVDVILTAQEILVSNASYPTERIRSNSKRYRPLGLGYANLGAVLMRRGSAYDSDEARTFAAALTAFVGGAAYAQSARMAAAVGAFEGFVDNRSSMLEVIERHRDCAKQIEVAGGELGDAASAQWAEALELGNRYGFRNAQTTVLAPTGTIGLLMDCDTTGVEPDIALVKFKRLVGGGTMKLVNRVVPMALEALGYDEPARHAILDFVDREGTVEGAPGFRAEHLPVFDCAFAHGPSGRTISAPGHLAMMAAVQPFISGAISKTVNLPSDASPEQIQSVFRSGHALGLKAVAIYRDGCKRVQPLSASDNKKNQLKLPRMAMVAATRGELPPCPTCGGSQVRSGSCYVCSNCGETTACA
ncbi:MAG: vitamin B12-dependent ribonucleotide reductase [Myxococcota bacterium]